MPNLPDKNTSNNNKNKTPTSKPSQTSPPSPSPPTDEEISPTWPEGDLPGALRSPAAEKLFTVYGDTVHQNCGSHLNGGITDDKEWQKYYTRLLTIPTRRYYLPSGSVGKRFVTILANLLRRCAREPLEC